ncbi:MAG TPA: surface-adhesin E family protein [Pyrinomonadaceae bacterium]|nr:surface-adhesin E family protein [Pyrinomonadaceae bacterium]
MKYIILLTLVICFGLTHAFGQADLIVIKTDAEKKAAAEAEMRRIEDANRWKPVASTDTTPPVLWFYQRSRRVRNDVEVWLKVVYPKPIVERGFAPVVYSMSFNVFHCGEGRVSVERLIGYNAKGGIVQQVGRQLDTFREPVNPGSVNEEMYAFFCG